MGQTNIVLGIFNKSKGNKSLDSENSLVGVVVVPPLTLNPVVKPFTWEKGDLGSSPFSRAEMSALTTGLRVIPLLKLFHFVCNASVVTGPETEDE